MTENNILRGAIRGAGGGEKLAGALGITRQAIYQWNRVPAERVLDVEKFSGVSRHVLRPDLYPDAPLPDPQHRQAVST